MAKISGLSVSVKNAAEQLGEERKERGGVSVRLIATYPMPKHRDLHAAYEKYGRPKTNVEPLLSNSGCTSGCSGGKRWLDDRGNDPRRQRRYGGGWSHYDYWLIYSGSIRTGNFTRKRSGRNYGV